MRVLITEPEDYSSEAVQIYQSFGKVSFLPNLSERQLKTTERETEILVIRLAHKIDGHWMDRFPKLKVIATSTTGLNHIDLKEAKRRKIKIISLKGHVSFLKNITSTAEETFGLILALVRNIPAAFDHVKDGGWNRNLWKGHQLNHKTLGLLGVGRLGKIVSGYGRAFGMNVIGSDPYVDRDEMGKRRIRKVNMKLLFKEADVLSVHIPLETKTDKLVRAEHFALMKKSSYFINTSRGEIIDELALLGALKEAKISGAALDVLTDERSNGDHLRENPLVAYAKSHHNLIIVPHMGGATYEAMEITEKYLAGLVKRHLVLY